MPDPKKVGETIIANLNRVEKKVDQLFAIVKEVAGQFSIDIRIPDDAEDLEAPDPEPTEAEKKEILELEEKLKRLKRQ